MLIQRYKKTYKPGDKLTVSLKVKNAGSVAGKEVVKFYISKLSSSVLRPEKELKAFKKGHNFTGLNDSRFNKHSYKNFQLRNLRKMACPYTLNSV